jgi:hypothetical protein
MNLQPGCRVIVAPHFHLTPDWSRRLSLGSGVEESNHYWRAPTEGELALLVGAGPSLPTSIERADFFCLFQLPEHIQSKWWNLLEQTPGILGDGQLPGFDAFASEIVSFLAFKEIPAPPGSRCSVVLSACEQDAAYTTRFSCVQDAFISATWGVINLGDETASLVLLNLTIDNLNAELQRRFPEQTQGETREEVVRHFLRSSPDAPLIRLRLQPGEGCRLPRGGVILGSHSEAEKNVEVWLVIS